MSRAEQDLGSSVPTRRDVGRVGELGVGFSGETEIGDLDGVRRGGRGRRDESGVSLECVACVGGRCRDEDVLGLDVAVEEVVLVDVLEARDDLEEDALDGGAVQALVVARLHELVEVAVHVLHGNVQLLAHGIQEDVEGGHKVGVVG